MWQMGRGHSQGRYLLGDSKDENGRSEREEEDGPRMAVTSLSMGRSGLVDKSGDGEIEGEGEMPEQFSSSEGWRTLVAPSLHP
jgi:hypothetical protein